MLEPESGMPGGNRVDAAENTQPIASKSIKGETVYWLTNLFSSALTVWLMSLYFNFSSWAFVMWVTISFAVQPITTHIKVMIVSKFNSVRLRKK